MVIKVACAGQAWQTFVVLRLHVVASRTTPCTLLGCANAVGDIYNGHSTAVPRWHLGQVFHTPSIALCQDPVADTFGVHHTVLPFGPAYGDIPNFQHFLIWPLQPLWAWLNCCWLCCAVGGSCILPTLFGQHDLRASTNFCKGFFACLETYEVFFETEQQAQVERNVKTQRQGKNGT